MPHDYGISALPLVTDNTAVYARLSQGQIDDIALFHQEEGCEVLVRDWNDVDPSPSLVILRAANGNTLSGADLSYPGIPDSTTLYRTR